MDQRTDLTVRDYLRPVLRFKWVILAIVLVVGVLTYMKSNGEPRVYESSTRVLLTGDNSVVGSASVLSDRTVNNQIALLSSPDVSKRVARSLGRPEYASAFAGAVSASGVADADYITITARWGDPSGAAKIADAFAKAFIDLRSSQSRRALQAAIDATQQQLDQVRSDGTALSQRQQLRETISRLRVDLAVNSGKAQQITPAFVPGAALSPNPKRDTLLAVAMALVGAIALAYAIAAFDRRLRRPEDVSTAYGLPVLAVLPEASKTAEFDDGRAAVSDDLREPLRHLRTNIRLARDEPARLILVTSAVPAEGKSTVVRNLAITFREAGARVAVVDADLRRPTLSELYHRSSSPGLTDVLVGDVDLEDALVSVPVRAHGLQTLARLSSGAGTATAVNGDGDAEFLNFLPSGPTPADPETVLASARLQNVLDRLLADHDIVLLDTAPILNVADTISLTHSADAMILVARVGQVTRDNARRLKETLARLSSTKQIGVVVNGARNQGLTEYGYSSAKKS